MAFEVTATRRRPQQFETLAGQEFVVSTLKNAIEQGRIAHAYLFSGPRGVGKTTSARLLAKALNCQHGPTSEPCGVCDNCRGIANGNSMDVIEIDGASNTGVNDVRVIKEEVLFPPTSSRYKIYIIDEVHMLSQSAFNALLKTIEEPPEYVVFIFATTETQKVPATIRSRCQQFNFQLLPLETIKGLLSDACREMNIQAEDEALFWIAKESTGSMRDAYTLFDQIVSFSDNNITMASIRDKLGLTGTDVMNSMMMSLISGDNQSCLSQVQALLAKGVGTEQIIKDFTDYFRTLLLIKEGVSSENVLGIHVQSVPKEILDAYNDEQAETALDMFLKLYRDIRYSLNPRFELELAISKLSRLRFVASNTVLVEQIARLKNDIISGRLSAQNPTLASVPDIRPIEVKTRQVVEEPATAVVSAPEPEPELAVVSEPEPEVVSEASPEALPVPETPAEAAPITEFTLETLKDVLPQGTCSVEKTEDGLVLQFNSRFFYENALRNIETVRKDVCSVAGEVNVIVSFSEKLEQERLTEIAKEQALNKPKPVPAPKAKPIEVEQEDESKYFFGDLVTAFKGHEEK